MKRKFAVPTQKGKLCAHFGHCEKFAIIETDGDKVTGEKFVEPPLVHEPGAYPEFLADMGVKTIISGGMGMKAQELFARSNIEVFYGVDAETPSKLVENYLNDELESGKNLCDH